MFKERLSIFIQIVSACLVSLFFGLIIGLSIYLILNVLGLSIELIYKILISTFIILILAGIFHTFKWLIIEPYVDYKKQKEIKNDYQS